MHRFRLASRKTPQEVERVRLSMIRFRPASRKTHAWHYRICTSLGELASNLQKLCGWASHTLHLHQNRAINMRVRE